MSITYDDSHLSLSLSFIAFDRFIELVFSCRFEALLSGRRGPLTLRLCPEQEQKTKKPLVWSAPDTVAYNTMPRAHIATLFCPRTPPNEHMSDFETGKRTIMTVKHARAQRGGSTSQLSPPSGGTSAQLPLHTLQTPLQGNTLAWKPPHSCTPLFSPISRLQGSACFTVTVRTLTLAAPPSPCETRRSHETTLIPFYLGNEATKHD